MSKPHSLPEGYAELKPDCDRFLSDHPDYERNVFIMTRFDPGNRLLEQLDQELRRTLCRHGLNALRADDRMYPTDRQLWKNVCIYMLCCDYGVAVLEDRGKDEFNPNVSLEYGFMRALNKPALLLKDVGFRNLRADIIGTLTAVFDITDITGTLAPAVEQWIGDLRLDVRGGPSELQQQALKAYQRLVKIECATFGTEEQNKECWYFGEEITVYRQLLQTRPDPAHVAALEEAYQRIVVGHDFRALPELVQRFARLANPESSRSR
jgi:hypothetical protein